MRCAVADTGPLRYLVPIGAAGLLPVLAGEVLIPPEVAEELTRPQTPLVVRTWMAAPPPWLRVQPAPSTDTDPGLARLDPGERATIALAQALGADAVLMDDRAGVAAARARGLAVIGTLGLLQRASRRGLLELPDTLARLGATNFRIRPELLDALLAEDRARRTQ